MTLFSFQSLALVLSGFLIAMIIIGVIYVIPDKNYKEFCGTNSAMMLSNWQTRTQQCVWFEINIEKSPVITEIYSRHYTCNIWNCSFDPNTTKLYQGKFVWGDINVVD